MREAVIVAYGRSAVGKAPKGTLKDTHPVYIGSTVMKGVLAKVPQLNPADIDDVVLGCAFQEAEQGCNIARHIVLEAGLPESVPAVTVNRFCSSGLQAISDASHAIMCGDGDVYLAGGVETMSMIPMGGNTNVPNADMTENNPSVVTMMGITAENIAERYGLTREELDEFSLESHKRAEAAQDAGKFDDEIIPIEAVKHKTQPDGTVVQYKVPFTKDEGIRRGLTSEALAKLRPVFRKNGKVTAGNSSQMNDAASVVVLMERKKAEELGIKPIAKFVSFATAGCEPDYMGLGPIYAVPKALKYAGLTNDDIDLWELNEAFASQSIACLRDLGLTMDNVNVNGGGISLGHPLGCTGGFLTCKVLSELKRRGKKRGLVTMCIGGGMGAAGIFEMC